MVKKLSEEEKNTIRNAAATAERTTDAELAVAVAIASDAYTDMALLGGMALGGAVALLLWRMSIIVFAPLLITIEFGICLFTLALPWLKELTLALAPKHLLHRRAAARAASEYVHLTHHLKAANPLVLLYISLAERYVHILSSREVRERIPDAEWNEVVALLTSEISTLGHGAAIANAATRMGLILQAVFPSTGRKHVLAQLTDVTYG